MTFDLYIYMARWFSLII